MSLLDAAITGGFLSVQLMRHEEACALVRLVPHSRYQQIVAALERKVRSLRRKYRLGPEEMVRQTVDGRSGGSYARS
jgi:hypothetical protein